MYKLLALFLIFTSLCHGEETKSSIKTQHLYLDLEEKADVLSIYEKHILDYNNCIVNICQKVALHGIKPNDEEKLRQILNEEKLPFFTDLTSPFQKEISRLTPCNKYIEKCLFYIRSGDKDALGEYVEALEKEIIEDVNIYSRTTGEVFSQYKYCVDSIRQSKNLLKLSVNILLQMLEKVE